MRQFDTGAVRDTDTDKPDYEGFLSPEVIVEFGKYMHHHRHLADGSVRASDNWQAGFPREVLIKSLWRHFLDLWLMHRTGVEQITRPDGETVAIDDALAGILFNVQGYWLQEIREHAASRRPTCPGPGPLCTCPWVKKASL